MKPDPIPPSMESIRLWSGVECPNEAARLGLADHLGLLKELAALRGTLGPSVGRLYFNVHGSDQTTSWVGDGHGSY